MVNRRLAGEARDLEIYRIVHGQLVRLFVGSHARWIRGRRRRGRGSALWDEIRDGGPQATTGRGRR